MHATVPTWKPAFSLVELMVVIAIIGILASLILIALNRGKAKAHQARCASNVRQFGVALCGFVTDNHVYPLASGGGGAAYPEHGEWWLTTLRRAGLDPVNTKAKRSSVLVCPSARSAQLLAVGKRYEFYGYNHSGLSWQTETNSLGLGGQLVWMKRMRTAPLVKESEVVSPSDMMAIGDGFTGCKASVLDGLPDLWRAADASEDPEKTRRSYARHQGKANVVFCDGHVEAPTLKFLFEEESDATLVRWNRDHQPHREKLKL